MRKQCCLAFAALFVAGCAAVSGDAIPTLMQLPTTTPTDVPTTTATTTTTPTDSRPTLPPTWTPTDTGTPTPTRTITPTPSVTPTITPTATATATPTAMLDAYVTGENGVNLRPGPGRQFNPPVALLAPLTELLLVGRTDDGGWYQVTTFDGLNGWVSASLIQSRLDPATIAVTWINTPTPEIPVFVPPPAQNLPPLETNRAFLPAVSQRVREIFQQGRQLGSRPNVFSKVGDSTTASQPFLLPIGGGAYDLGPYLYLQDTINFFAVPPRDGVPNSFVAPSLAASNAFNAAAVLSPVWTDETMCQPNESPLTCEYRLNKPGVAIILLGAVDMQIYPLDQYRASMEQIVQTSIAQGVIPVLTTFPTSPGFFDSEAEAFNSALRDIAAAEQIPLIDLRAAAQSLPDNGVGSDYFHLSNSGLNGTYFTGDETRWGLTLRELLTLQALDILRRDVLSA